MERSSQLISGFTAVSEVPVSEDKSVLVEDRRFVSNISNFIIKETRSRYY